MEPVITWRLQTNRAEGNGNLQQHPAQTQARLPKQISGIKLIHVTPFLTAYSLAGDSWSRRLTKTRLEHAHWQSTCQAPSSPRWLAFWTAQIRGDGHVDKIQNTTSAKHSKPAPPPPFCCCCCFVKYYIYVNKEAVIFLPHWRHWKPFKPLSFSIVLRCGV